MAAKTIKEINNKYSYTDENPGGKTDASLVSCAQCENYNELQYIYDKKLKPYIDKNKFTEQKAITALEETCNELKNPRKRTDFYEKLSTKLDITIE